MSSVESKEVQINIKKTIMALLQIKKHKVFQVHKPPSMIQTSHIKIERQPIINT